MAAKREEVPDDYHLLGDDNHHSYRRGNLKSYKEVPGSQTIQFLHLLLFSLSPSYFLFISLSLTPPPLYLS
jgi:hypothetical protein